MTHSGVGGDGPPVVRHQPGRLPGRVAARDARRRAGASSFPARRRVRDQGVADAQRLRPGAAIQRSARAGSHHRRRAHRGVHGRRSAAGRRRRPRGGAPRPPAEAAQAAGDDIPPVRPPVRGDFSVRVPIKAGTHELGAAFLKKSSALTVTPRQWFLRPMAGIGDTRYQPQVGGITVAGPFNPTGPGDTPAPAPHLHVPAREQGGRSQLRQTDPVDAGAPCLPAAGDGGGPRSARWPSSTRGARHRHLRGWRRARAPPAPRQPGLPPPHRQGSVGRAAPAPRIASAMSIWRRGSPFSCGAASRTSRCSISPSRASSRIPPCSSSRSGGCSRIRAPTRLIENFAGQWLYLRNVPDKVTDGGVFPDFEGSLRDAFASETELFFASILRDPNASVLELLRANYTFLNQQLAQYYGIPNVYGRNFRRVDARRGRAHRRPARPGQPPARHLVSDAHRADDSRQVDHEHAARHSAARAAAQHSGAAGEHPPAGAVSDGGLGPHPARTAPGQLPACAGCHKLMDPLGLALENFDAVGRWRTTAEDGTPIDAIGGALRRREGGRAETAFARHC